MADDEIYRIAEEFSKPYLKLSMEVKEKCGLPREALKNEPIYEEYTFKEIVEGIYGILLEIKRLQRVPVVNFAAGGVATPADAALMMHMGMDGVFVGSGIFKGSNPKKMARAIVEAVKHYDEPEALAEICRDIGEPMAGLEVEKLLVRMEERGL